MKPLAVIMFPDGRTGGAPPRLPPEDRIERTSMRSGAGPSSGRDAARTERNAMPAFASLAPLAVAATLVAATAAAAEGQPQPCADRASIIERLEKRFGEVRQAMGLNRGNSVVEVFASAETGTWTILVTTPNGVSCMIASGELWESRTPLRRPEQDA
jgi:hypothetical protein